ncbi:DUF4274 domain-containing protein [Listeria grandensis]|uniref:DUF4274 domain-containing protein n=1 Tax=Listeria grandensis TaxID=1494963 RepID=UPI003CC8265D
MEPQNKWRALKIQKCFMYLQQIYNWYNGFSMPNEIISNDNCDMVLMMFYLSEGIRLLEDKESVEQSRLDERSKFITAIYSMF